MKYKFESKVKQVLRYNFRKSHKKWIAPRIFVQSLKIID